MKNLFNNQHQLKYLSFKKYTALRLRVYSSVSNASAGRKINSLVKNKNILKFTKANHGLINLQTHLLTSVLLNSVLFNFTRGFSQVPFRREKYLNQAIESIESQNNGKAIENNKKKDNLSNPNPQDLKTLPNLTGIGRQSSPSSSSSPSLLSLNKLRAILKKSKKNSLLLSKESKKRSSKKIITLTERDWKEMWSRKFTKFIRLGMYTPDVSDTLLFAYLNEKKQNIKSKYTFNDYLSGSQLITYNFNKNIKKIDLNSLYKILKSFFRNLSSLISFPKLEYFPDKIKIRLFYYVIPSTTKKDIQKILHRYIRSDEKLYKEIILRRKFKSIIEKFKMKLFIAKWKEDNKFIRTPDPISFFKGLSLGPLSYPLNYSSLIGSSTSRDSLVTLNNNLINPNNEFNISYEYKAPLEYLKLDLSKLFQQHDQLKSLFGSGALTLTNKSLDIVNLKYNPESSLLSLHKSLLYNNKEGTNTALISSIYNPEQNPLLGEIIKMRSETVPNESLQAKTSAAESLQYKLMSVISNSKDIAAKPLPKTEENLKVQLSGKESLKNLKDRKVSTMVSLNKIKFKYLIFTLEKLFKKTIILDLVRLKYPYHDSHILAQVLGLSSKTKNFRSIMKKLLYTATVSNPTKMVRTKNFSTIPSFLSGLKVRLAGRLITQRVVPRFTIQSFQIGSLARGKINFTDSSRITLKNKRGAFSFTVSTSHIFEK